MKQHHIYCVMWQINCGNYAIVGWEVVLLSRTIYKLVFGFMLAYHR